MADTPRISLPGNPTQPGLWNGLNGGRDDSIEDAIDIKVDPDTGETEVHLGDPEPDDDEGEGSATFDDNLADKIESVNSLAAEIVQGIEADEASQSEWVDNYKRGMDFLGLKIEDRSQQAQRKNCSTITHPLLLWACVNGQSMARAELLPSAGPVKAENDGSQTGAMNELVDQFEQDMNHYLTVTASEYYPDTDRGLFYLYYGGTIYKKVYQCPLRERPVSECIYMPDLIVSNDATDLKNAVRVTHRISMTRAVMRRMQLAGWYRDMMLVQPQPEPTEIARKEAEVSGRAATPPRQEDQPHTLYECYTDIDMSKYGHEEKGQPLGLPLPWRITIDKDSKDVLEVRRNWEEGDDDFKARRRFVKYGLVPGMGFLDLGYLHLLGNHTRALTGIWRIMVDAGMFSNFPGGARVKGVRLATNEIQPGPGEWVEIDTGPVDDIRKALMPLPYKGPSAELMQLAESIEQEGKEIAGTVTVNVGEGKANVPVGSILSTIEMQTQTMQAVHKRLHASAQEEFVLMKELFEEYPECLTMGVKNPVHKWTSEEIQNLTMVPASDPNIPAQMHRILQATALATLASSPATAPLYNQINVQKRLLKTLRIGDYDELLNPPQQPGQGPPHPDELAASVAQQEVQARQREIGVKQQQIAVTAKDNQTKADLEAAKLKVDMARTQTEAQHKMADVQSKAQIKQSEIATKANVEQAKLQHDAQQKERDRAVDLHKHVVSEQTARLGHTLGHIAAMKAKEQPAKPKKDAKK